LRRRPESSRKARKSWGLDALEDLENARLYGTHAEMNLKRLNRGMRAGLVKLLAKS
jgi:hypothetical protein